MKIIDSHTHLNSASDLTYLAHEMTQCGIGRIIFSNLGDFSQYPDAAHIRQFNDEAWRIVQTAPERLSFLTYLNPQLPNWRDELLRHLEHSVGVKLWISQKTPGSSSLAPTVAVLQACAQRKLPVLLHVFNRTYHNLPGEIDILEFEQLALSVPNCTMIAAHAGACYHDSCGIFRRMPRNVYWDFSGSFPANQLVEEVLKELPADRLLYGSDGLGRTFASQLLKIQAAAISPEQKAAILYRNAATIYQLPEPPDLPSFTPKNSGLQECDYHCYSGHDPFGVTPYYSPEQLAQFMAAHQVKAAYCTNLDTLLHWDPAPGNVKFAQACAPFKELRPLWSCNVQAHNFVLTAQSAAQYPVGGIWCSLYWSATSPADPRVLKLGIICQQLQLPLFLHLGGPAEDRFRFPGVAPRLAIADEVTTLLKQLPGCTIYLQGAPQGVELGSNLHHIIQFSPLDNPLDSPIPGVPLWGSGFPYRSFPVN